MSYENKESFFPSKAVFRGKMLVASFPEATPPVLWRWLAADVSSGFGLRKNESKVELLRYDGGATPAVVATFASVEAGERALGRLSGALLNYNAPWTYFAKALAAFVSLAALLGAGLFIYYSYQQVEADHHLLPTTGQHTTTTTHHTAEPAAVAPTGHLQQEAQQYLDKKKQEDATKETPPAPGASVDVDSVYH